MPNGGYIAENGISLCKDCHFEAERHFNEYAEGFNDELPQDEFCSRILYEKIGSSRVKAFVADGGTEEQAYL